MTRQLPSNPNLSQLKHQAKDLVKAHRNQDASCCEILRRHRRFMTMTDEEILCSKVGLREAQHALALEYGFDGWAQLKRRLLGTTPQEQHRMFWDGVAAASKKGRGIADAFEHAVTRIDETPLAAIVKEVVSRARSGESVWQAMGAHASEFTVVVCLLCRAAEASIRHWPAIAERIREGMHSGILAPDAPVEDNEQASFWGVFGLCLSSGVPILALLDILKESYVKSDGLKRAVADLHASISRGETIADAMVKHRDVFQPTVVSMIRDGERVGKLEIAAQKVSQWLRDGFYETEEEFLMDDSRASAVMQMLREGLERGVAEIVFDPSERSVNGDGVQLPTFRPKFVLSDGTEQPWRMWVHKKQILEIERTLKAQTRLDPKQSGDTMTGKLHIRVAGRDRQLPVSYCPGEAGPLIRIGCAERSKVPAVTAQEVHRFLNYCATAVSQGEPLLRVLRGAAQEADGAALKDTIRSIGVDVEAGSALSEAMAKHEDVFNATCLSLVRVGEATGELDKFLRQIVDLRLAFAGDLGSEGESTALRYVNLLLFSMRGDSGEPVVLKRSRSLPKLPVPGTSKEIGAEFPRVVNRLKIMCALDPITYPNPTTGTCSLKLQGQPYEVQVDFDDRADDPLCRITVRQNG